jgi:hypothetical protein
MAVDVFEVDADGIAALVRAHICDDGTSPDGVSLLGERAETGGDDIGRERVVVTGSGRGCDHLGLAIDADGSCVRVELAFRSQLLLCEAERGVDQVVEVGLRLG